MTTVEDAALAWNLAAGVWRRSEAAPDSPALVLEAGSLGYGELAREAGKVAGWIDDAVATASDADATPPRIGVLASRSVECFAGILGAAWSGSTYVPLNPSHPPARLASVLERAGLAALVVDARGAARLDSAQLSGLLPRALLLPEELAALPAPAAAPPRAVTPSHPAYVIFTSGTTGTPKGVVVPAGAVGHFLAAMRELYAIGPGDRSGQFCETTFDLSVFEIFSAFDGGAALCVVPESKLLAPAGFIREQRLSIWTSVPSLIPMLERMKLLGPGRFPDLRVSYFIGEALPVASARAWQEAAPNSVVDNHYGPTEAAVACTMLRVGRNAAETPGRGTLSIGRPYDGMQVEVVDAEGRFVADGESGELALAGPQLADGYLGDEELTAQRFRFLEHPVLGRRRFYLTGDLGFRDENGLLHCLGRVDHQVKVLGHRIELEDIEAQLRASSGSDAVAALAWPLANGSAQGLVAFVAGSSLSAKAIREKLQGLLPAYMIPRSIRLVESLPLSSSGKVDRRALAALLEEQAK